MAEERKASEQWQEKLDGTNEVLSILRDIVAELVKVEVLSNPPGSLRTSIIKLMDAIHTYELLIEWYTGIRDRNRLEEAERRESRT